MPFFFFFRQYSKLEYQDGIEVDLNDVDIESLQNFPDLADVSLRCEFPISLNFKISVDIYKAQTKQKCLLLFILITSKFSQLDASISQETLR